MNYAIIGTGKEGQAIASAFARKEIEVAIASRRPVEVLAPVAKAIGPTIIPKSLKDAVKADIVLLAVPFGTQKEVAKAAESWQGKVLIDVTNAYGVAPEELGNLPSSVVISQAFPGAKLVKAFNSLSAEVLAQDPNVQGGKRVVFLSSDDEGGAAQVATLVEQLGFAPVQLGKLAEGGLLIQARGKTWAQLIFQDLVKFQ
ncbi:MAG: NADPH-dependent F420 reductase [Candidatus Sulfotelmatobacter sp.]